MEEDHGQFVEKASGDIPQEIKEPAPTKPVEENITLGDCDQEASIEADDSATPVECGRCGWQGYSGDLEGAIGNCPSCGSSWKVTEKPSLIEPRELKPGEVLESAPLPEGSPLKEVLHKSDCAVHNEPAYPAGPCNCGASEAAGKSDAEAIAILTKEETLYKCKKCGWLGPESELEHGCPKCGWSTIKEEDITPADGPKAFSDTFKEHIDVACVHANPQEWPCDHLDHDVGCPPDCEHKVLREKVTMLTVDPELFETVGFPMVCPACSAVFSDKGKDVCEGDKCPACSEATLELVPDDMPLPPPWNPDAILGSELTEDDEPEEEDTESYPIVRVCMECLQPIQEIKRPGVHGKLIVCKNKECYRVGLVTMVVKPMYLKDGRLHEVLENNPTAGIPQAPHDPKCTQRKKGKRCIKKTGHNGAHQYHPTSTRPKGQPRGRK